MAGVKGQGRGRVRSNAERDAVTLAKLESWIDQILDGHVTCAKCESKFPAKELQPSAVALLKVRYDKLRPSLSAVEQTTVNPERDHAAILADIRAAIADNPSAIKDLFPGYELVKLPEAVVTEPGIATQQPVTH